MAADLQQELRKLGRRLAELRRSAGLTQEELSLRVDVSMKYLQRVEAGRHNLSVGALVQIANALQVPLRRLFDRPRTLKVNRGRPAKRVAKIRKVRGSKSAHV